MKSVNDLEEKL